MADRAPTATLIPLSLILPGMALALLGSQHLDGFFKGLCQGAGIALILLGVYILGAHWRRARDGDDGAMWLPSRDENQQ